MARIEASFAESSAQGLLWLASNRLTAPLPPAIIFWRDFAERLFHGRIALTGTPVENHLGDLWSIFDFCCPGLLGSAAQFKQFVKRLNREQDTTAFGALRRLVQPYILRRLKTDPSVIPDQARPRQ